MTIVQCNGTGTPSVYFGVFEDQIAAQRFIRVHGLDCKRRHFLRSLHDPREGMRLTLVTEGTEDARRSRQ